MKKKVTKRFFRVIRKFINPEEAMEIFKKEYEDVKGNKSKVIYDVRPHNPNKPTIEMQNTSIYTPKGDN